MRFFAFGEALIDIIVQADGKTFSSPGGSLLNVAVSMARAGAAVELISDFGLDEPGKRLHSFLESEGVGVSYLNRFTNGQTPLAYAALDADAKASYTFYKRYPETRFTEAKLPHFTPGDCFVFGSFSSVQEPLQPVLEKLLKQAQSSDSFIFFDPNIRQHKLSREDKAMNYLRRNIGMADLVRGSDEDFEAMLGTSDIEKVKNTLEISDKVPLIITRGASVVECLHLQKRSDFAVPILKNLVSTIGAGDAFDAGLLCFLDVQRMSKNELRTMHPDMLGMMIATAVSFATDVCQSPENFISKTMATNFAAFRQSL